MDYRIREGLDLHLAGVAEREISPLPLSDFCFVKPSDFRWLTPKLTVMPGDSVQVGTPLMVDKNDERVAIVSPVCGKVHEIVRGDRRAIECVSLAVDVSASSEAIVPVESSAAPADIRATLLQYGLWPCLRQRPFSLIPPSTALPKALFVSCFDSAPLAPDFALLMREREADFAEGIRILKCLVGRDVPVHLCFRPDADNAWAELAQNVEIHNFIGPHPAGNVGTQVHRIAPLDKSETIWYIHPFDVARIGRLFSSHCLSFDKIFAATGPACTRPRYFSSVYGTDLSSIFSQSLKEENVRKISGNVLTGSEIDKFPSLRFYDFQLTFLPEETEREFLGWLLPGFNKWSFSHTFTAWMKKRKIFGFNTLQHGDRRNFVMTDIYEKVFPFDAILPLELLKACMTHDLENMEELGLYEVDDEDFALCEVVCPSKMPCQQIIRDGLFELRNA
ncbi:MAG: NADH:ubiquinone reductase (Na(+)-transporting) subunit A [Bacteroidales bacterium]|nr:NADH:ubiquinone reductase (Na(+)-transporting) subunit A [Bacteroidales bacterium]